MNFGNLGNPNEEIIRGRGLFTKMCTYVKLPFHPGKTATCYCWIRPGCDKKEQKLWHKKETIFFNQLYFVL